MLEFVTVPGLFITTQANYIIDMSMPTKVGWPKHWLYETLCGCPPRVFVRSRVSVGGRRWPMAWLGGIFWTLQGSLPSSCRTVGGLLASSRELALLCVHRGFSWSSNPLCLLFRFGVYLIYWVVPVCTSVLIYNWNSEIISDFSLFSLFVYKSSAKNVYR